MVSSKRNNKARSIGNFAALKTAIAIGDVAQIKDLLPDEPMVTMEKDYLGNL